VVTGRSAGSRAFDALVDAGVSMWSNRIRFTYALQPRDSSCSMSRHEGPAFPAYLSGRRRSSLFFRKLKQLAITREYDADSLNDLPASRDEFRLRFGHSGASNTILLGRMRPSRLQTCRSCELPIYSSGGAWIREQCGPGPLALVLGSDPAHGEDTFHSLLEGFITSARSSRLFGVGAMAERFARDLSPIGSYVNPCQRRMKIPHFAV